MTKEPYGGLSNMAPHYPLNVNDVIIRSSEALYQACRFPNNPEFQKIIINQKSPMTAKMKSKSFTNDTRSDWMKVRVDVMRWCLHVKLVQNWTRFNALLMSTNNLPIVEVSPKNSYWAAKRTDKNSLIGINALGRLLMEIRDEVRDISPKRLLKVIPPDVSQFLLYGNPIGEVLPPEISELDLE